MTKQKPTLRQNFASCFKEQAQAWYEVTCFPTIMLANWAAKKAKNADKNSFWHIFAETMKDACETHRFLNCWHLDMASKALSKK